MLVVARAGTSQDFSSFEFARVVAVEPEPWSDFYRARFEPIKLNMFLRANYRNA